MPRVALIHDWLTGMRGGEKCLERACQMYPDSEIFTLFHDRGSVAAEIEDRPIHVSHLGKIPGWRKHYRYLLPLFPAAAQWRPTDVDFVLSFSHCVAKAATPPAGVPHLCYCFTPMRYAWHMREQYFGAAKSLTDRAREAILSRLREWDRRTSDRVSHFIAISKTVAGRIRECYGRDSYVIYPPVDTAFYHPAPVVREDYYLVVSAFAPYKRIDLAVSACERAGRKLVVIGQGQDEPRLRSLAGPDTTFLGWQSDASIRDHLRRCRALLFPGEEDFGIVPLEAQACGTPVIAFGRGGATETVLDGETGLLFPDQTVEGMTAAIADFERIGEWDRRHLRSWAEGFANERFDRELAQFVDGVLGDYVSRRRAA